MKLKNALIAGLSGFGLGMANVIGDAKTPEEIARLPQWARDFKNRNLKTPDITPKTPEIPATPKLPDAIAATPDQIISKTPEADQTAVPVNSWDKVYGQDGNALPAAEGISFEDTMRGELNMAPYQNEEYPS